MVEKWQQTSQVAKYEHMRKINEVQKKINKIQTRLSVLMEEVDALNKDDRLGD
jgi:cell division protein FtsL